MAWRKSTSGGQSRVRLFVSGLIVILALMPSTAPAVQHLMVIDEVLASWQGDNEVQFIELRMVAPGQNLIAGAEIEILDRDGENVIRLLLTVSVPNALQDARILIGSPKLGNLAGLTPDFLLDPPDIIPRNGGRICYRVPVGGGQTARVDCVAYGPFTGNNDSFGEPTPITPDNRSLQRGDIPTVADNAEDFVGVLSPTPQTNLGVRGVLDSMCLDDDRIDGGEDCDGENLDGMTCVDFDFVGGTLRCTQCKFDTSECTDCGNDMVDADEECDGTDLDDQTCARLGYTQGILACADDCTFDIGACSELQIPGKGSKKKTCFLQWNVINPGGNLRKGQPPVQQKCVDGDPTCDFDGVTANSCTFQVHLCVNRDDSRNKRCSPSGVSTFRLKQPSATSEDPTDQGNASALLGAVAALGISTEDADVVTFTPALETVDQCSLAANVVVPLKERPGKRPKKGKRVLKTTTVAGNGKRRDNDKIKLVCLPGG